MKSSQLTFGIEIECYIPSSKFSPAEVGSYHQGLQVDGFPAGWQAKTDGSIRDFCPSGYTAVEIVSPILQGEDGLIQVVAVVDWLKKQAKAIVDDNCGLHVHVGAGHLTTSQIVSLVDEYKCYEKVLFALNGKKAQSRWENWYCKPSHKWLPATANQHNQRYQSLNLTNLMTPKKTVEFRLGAGTLDVEQILAFVIAFTGLVAKVVISPRQHRVREMNLSEFLRNVVGRFSMVDLGGRYSKFKTLVKQSGMF